MTICLNWPWPYSIIFSLPTIYKQLNVRNLGDDNLYIRIYVIKVPLLLMKLTVFGWWNSKLLIHDSAINIYSSTTQNICTKLSKQIVQTVLYDFLSESILIEKTKNRKLNELTTICDKWLSIKLHFLIACSCNFINY